MTSIMPQPIQNTQAAVDGSKPAIGLFRDNLNSSPNFKEALMSSVGQGAGSVATGFQPRESTGDRTMSLDAFIKGRGVTGVRYSLLENANSFQQNIGASEQALFINSNADRFDMTGVFGHSHAQIESSTEALESLELVSDIEEMLTDNVKNTDQEYLLDVKFVDDLSTKQTSRHTERNRSIPLRKSSKPQAKLSINEGQKLNMNMMDVSQFIDADASSLSLNMVSETSDGSAEVQRSSVKSLMPSLLSTSAAYTQSNQLMVALQTLENGLRLYARVQNMSPDEQSELRHAVKNLLLEKGFSDAEVVIDSIHSEAK